MQCLPFFCGQVPTHGAKRLCGVLRPQPCQSPNRSAGRTIRQKQLPVGSMPKMNVSGTKFQTALASGRQENFLYRHLLGQAQPVCRSCTVLCHGLPGLFGDSPDDLLRTGCTCTEPAPYRSRIRAPAHAYQLAPFYEPGQGLVYSCATGQVQKLLRVNEFSCPTVDG